MILRLNLLVSTLTSLLRILTPSFAFVQHGAKQLQEQCIHAVAQRYDEVTRKKRYRQMPAEFRRAVDERYAKQCELDEKHRVAQKLADRVRLHPYPSPK